MEGEELFKSGNIQKYGFFFWIMLAGIVILILTVIHGFAPRYGGLGIIFFTGGIMGYCFSELVDRYSAHKYNGHPTYNYHLYVIIGKFLILIAIVIVAQYVYHFFPIAASVLPKEINPLK